MLQHVSLEVRRVQIDDCVSFWKLLVDGAKRYVFDVSKDVGERNELTNQRQDVARRLRPLIAAWEADVDAEAKANAGTTTR